MKWVILLGVLLSQFSVATSADEFTRQFLNAAHERTKQTVIYNGAYFSIEYPNGDVPEHFGVCTDVIIRSYRKLGVDLQKLVHEDLKTNFSAYPTERIWRQTVPDRNIDHRRVPNLQVFFKRFGSSLVVSKDKADYKPGDIVTWSLPGNLPHIGIVSDKKANRTGNPLIIHNIGAGPKIDDMLFDYVITGHYRYVPPKYHTQD